MPKKGAASRAKVQGKFAAKAVKKGRATDRDRVKKERSAAMIRANFGDVLEALSKE